MGGDFKFGSSPDIEPLTGIHAASRSSTPPRSLAASRFSAARFAVTFGAEDFLARQISAGYLGATLAACYVHYL
jgi:hypothetical protein